jgi:hypothetical protein
MKRYYLISIGIILGYLLIRYIVDTKILVENFAGASEITAGPICSLFSSTPTVLNEKCRALTEKNCVSTSCCTWLNDKGCVAGKNGIPIFR